MLPTSKSRSESRRLRRAGLVSSFVVLGVLGAACGSDSDEPQTSEDLESVVFRLDWIPAADHSLFFLALERGYFADEGLDVEIKDGTGSGNTVTQVGAGQEEFGFANLGTMTLAIAREDVPVLSVAAMTQDPSSVLFRADAGISEPAELEGLTWGKTPGSSTEAMFLAFAEETGIDLSTVNEVTVEAAAKITSVASGDVDFGTSFAFQEIPRLAEKGMELDAFVFADYGVSVLGQGIIVNKQFADESPDLVRGFVTAAVKAAHDALENPEDALDALSEHRPESNYNRETFMAQFEGYKQFLGDPDSIGQQDEAEWQRTVEVLEQYMDLPPGVDVSTLYTNEFLESQ